MGLFNEYFNESSNQSSKDLNLDSVDKYVRIVGKIAEIDFHRSIELVNQIESNQKEYFKTLLVKYEPKILSIMILGYYMLRDLKLHKEYGRYDINDLLLENRIYREVISGFVHYIAGKGDDISNAMASSVVSMNYKYSNYDKIILVQLYFSSRFKVYADDIVHGLQYFMSFPNNDVVKNYNPSLEKAYYSYSYPYAGDEKESNYEKLKGREIFRDEVINSYFLVLKMSNE